MQNHNWERVSDCLNGPHLWQCKICHEWTRSYKQPAPEAELMDPENGEHYTSRPCNVFPIPAEAFQSIDRTNPCAEIVLPNGGLCRLGRQCVQSPFELTSFWGPILIEDHGLSNLTLWI